MNTNTHINNNPELIENKEIISTLIKNLIQIQTTTNNDNNTDIELIGQYIKSKEIIGLGEATHGTKEFQDMRTRIISYLVSKLGYRTIVLEESYSHCLRINSYILGGNGTAEEAVKEGLCFPWVFKTEETVALVKWLRKYNDCADSDSKVRFFGMDFVRSQKAVEVIAVYIRNIDINIYDRIKNELDFLSDINNKGDFKSLEHRIYIIGSIFINNRDKFINISGERKYNEIFRCVEAYKQWIDYQKNNSEFNIRDRYMFENVRWIFDSSKKYNDGKLIIIAHNDHIQKGVALNAVENKQLGYWLNNEYKEQYYNIGFDFSRGSFYSFDMNDDYKLKIFEVDKSNKNDMAAVLFEKTNIPMFYLDLKTLAQKSSAMFNFITSINRYNAIGAIYDHKDFNFGVDELILKNMYDALIYIKNTNNTTLLNS